MERGLHSPDEAGGDVVPPVGVQVHRVPAVAPHEVRRTRDRRWLTISFRWPASAIGRLRCGRAAWRAVGVGDTSLSLHYS